STRGTPCDNGKNGDIRAIWRSLRKNRPAIRTFVRKPYRIRLQSELTAPEPRGISTLFLHGIYNQYYRIGSCRGNFESFLSAGGKGKFFSAPMGHALVFKPILWKYRLDQYMADIIISRES
ncbi:hypothetical protein ACFFKG_18155, partial [Aureimonas pseudogalii]